MAAVTSLGIHKPSALPYLIDEGILTPETAEDPSRWHNVKHTVRDTDAVEEELLATDYCVIWSRGGVIQRVFRFDTEQEKITEAVFAKFPSNVPPTARGAGFRPRNGEKSSGTAAAGFEATQPRDTPSRSQSTESEPEQSTTKASLTAQSLDSHEGKEWALVVISRTQAHVFFLAGTSHIVHLPFEVGRVFPLPEGILLQRKLPANDEPEETSPHSKPLPVVPPNSFAFSQQSIWEQSASQAHSVASDLRRYDEEDLPFSSMLKKVLQGASTSKTSNLPRLFSLTDPLSQLGIVGIRRARSEDVSTESFAPTSNALNPKEDLLYVSSQNELGGPKSRAPVSGPLTLAVTLNQETKAVTVWNITRVTQLNNGARKRRLDSIASGTLSRRRSSRGPGYGTGANTPIQRAGNARDSSGFSRPQARTKEDNPPVVTDNFSLSLDTAFESPTRPAKSSRRVSSLLARADLSTSQDNTTFSELAGGYGITQHARRGPSFGADPIRLSFTRGTGMSMSRSRPRKGIRASIESQSLHGLESDEDLDDIDKMDALSAFDALDIGDGACGLRQEYELTEIYTTAVASHSDMSVSGSAQSERPTVYTLVPPSLSLRDDNKEASVYLCLTDRVAQTLLSLRIQVRPLPNIRVRSVQHELAAAGQGNGQNYITRVTNIARLKGVVDACKIQEDSTTRVLVLSQSQDSMGSLSLHAPWSTPHDIALPATLNIYDPTKIIISLSPRQKREGGFKRVISQSPQALSALHYGDSNGKVDVVDSEGVRHRLHVQLQPRNPLVRRVIEICEAVMPLSGDRRETILCAWWTVVSWLRSRPEVEDDVEWTALIVILFSLPAGSIQHWHSEPASRQKRRKVGLLRSSSGANTDLASWEAMLSQEAGRSSSLPPWMQDPAWRWVTEPDSSAESRQVSTRSASSTRPMGLSNVASIPAPKKSAYVLQCCALAREALQSSSRNDSIPSKLNILSFLASQDNELRGTITANLLVGLHLLREEFKLNTAAAGAAHSMIPILAQLGGWLGWRSWGFKNSTYYMLESADMENWLFDESAMTGRGSSANEPFEPPSILRHIEKLLIGSTMQPFVTLLDLIDLPVGPTNYLTASESIRDRVQELTPRTMAIANLFARTSIKTNEFSVEDVVSSNIGFSFLETLPESIATAVRSSLSQAQAFPSSSWRSEIFDMVGRDDIRGLGRSETNSTHTVRTVTTSTNSATHDVHSICASAVEMEPVGAYDGSAEADRQSITRMIFKDDQRFAEAARLLHPLTAPTARCVPEPSWSDTELLEAQQELVKIIATRTLSVSPGRGLLFYSARSPLLTEKYPIHGFTLSCVMKPSNTTVTADRNAYSEEKVSWAFFHAGVEAGLCISKDAKGIDTSWLLFNKPHELKNRHAGFLLALGLNGHMRNIAKWASYKYLTPKHTMTSIGFLLGISASYLGTMDTNITRLLSVHVTRMLPAGAAELNLSPVTQTSGVMGIGLLYCNTQHRRMSEIMLSEIENTDQEENANPLESLRDEGYRLAAGFALGYINLGRGRDLKGLRDMNIVERLLVLAVGTKRANLVHVLDQATAAATIAIALIFMKTDDVTVARKIDVPDTIHQFDYVRPDILLLRTVARHLIMWDQIRPSPAWMLKQLPSAFQSKQQRDVHSLSSQELPKLNVVAGLCLSLGLRYAGTGSQAVRDILCHQLDQFMWMCRYPSTNYDQKLTRITARNCQDTVALAAACVMAGFGDLKVFRRLRALHGRTDAETPYGSHLAAHLAIGVLFLGGGTHSFGTTNVAVASLLCAFYPLFPTAILDNKSHLQAFRHFWVLATEPRCLVIRDIDTHRPLAISVVVRYRNKFNLPLTAPCLLPALEEIAAITTNDPAYWSVTLDIADNPNHLTAFKRHQTIYVRRRAAGDSHSSVFSATMLALNDAQAANQLSRQVFSWIFTLPVFERFDRTEQALVLPPGDLTNVMQHAARGTAIDDCLVLTTGCMDSGRSERLWNLRLLFAWADALSARSGRWGWLREDVVGELRAKLCLKITGAERAE
ncbi:MAG: hypothetical protein Q9225_001895 [Loekoesia sp. 1 TL-2023]